MERRTFLKTFALGGAAASVGPSLIGQQLQAAPSQQVSQPGAAPPAKPFFQGTVHSRSGDSLVLASGGSNRAVKSGAATTTWKETDGAGFANIVPGDFLYVSGVSLSDGTVAAERVWANIGWAHGTVKSSNGSAVTVATDLGNKTVEFSDATEVYWQGVVPLPVASVSGPLFAEGREISAIGVLLSPARMRATKVWLSPPTMPPTVIWTRQRLASVPTLSTRP